MENNWDLIHQSIWVTIKTACQSFWTRISQISRTAGGVGGEMAFQPLALWGVSHGKLLHFPLGKYWKEYKQNTIFKKKKWNNFKQGLSLCIYIVSRKKSWNWGDIEMKQQKMKIQIIMSFLCCLLIISPLPFLSYFLLILALMLLNL